MNKRSKNPVLQKKYDEGFMKGYEVGRDQAVSFFVDKLKGLEHVEGIGPKTLDKIINQLGHQYFREV